MSTEGQPLLASSQIRIDAPVSRVWDVLVKPEYIKQWDDVPEGFAAPSLTTGTVLDWPGSARLELTVCDPHSRLRLAYQNPKWDVAVDGIAYDYELQEAPGGSLLIISVGDWAKAPDGRAQDYYDASMEFAQAAVGRIKELAEG